MFALGQPVPLSILVKDSTGAAANGGTVTLTITLPDGTTATPTVPSPSPTGTYAVSYTPTMAGTHGVRWVVTGTNASAPPPDSFTVYAASSIPLVSLADVRAHMNGAVTIGDAELADAVMSMSAAIEAHCNQAFTTRTVVETHAMTGSPWLLLRTLPTRSVTSVTVDGVADTAWTLDVVGGVLTRTYGGWSGTVVVTYVAGHVGVPDDVRLAVLRWVEGMWQRSQQAPHGAFGGANDEWSPTVADGIPYAVRQLLTPHVRPAIA